MLRRTSCLLISIACLSLGFAETLQADDAFAPRARIQIDAPTAGGTLSSRATPAAYRIPTPQANRVDLTSDAPASFASPSVMRPSSGALFQAASVSGVRPAPQKRWSVIAALYLWATDIDGTSYADGQVTNIDIAFSDLFEKLEFAGMGYVEGRYDRWSFAVDASVVSLEGSRTGPAGAGALGAKLDQTILDFRLGYTVFCRKTGSDRWGRCCHPRGMTLDAIVGTRYWNFDQKIDVLPPQGGPITVDNNTSWWDLYVGARFRWQFAKRWGMTAYADYGGFGLGDSSESTFEIQAHVNYRITRGLFASLGYRVLDVDHITGSGATKNGVNATYSGPILGVGYEF